MEPKRQEISGQNDLFLATLERILSTAHPMCKLANAVNWEVFLARFGENYAQGIGRSAFSTRLMVGIHYLKYAYDVSDQQAVATFLENPY